MGKFVTLNEISFTVNGPCDTDTFPEISTPKFNAVFLDTVIVSLNVEEPVTLRVDERVVALDTFNVEERLVASVTVTSDRVVIPLTLSDEAIVVALFTIRVESSVVAFITCRLFKEVSIWVGFCSHPF